jgi:hypothetical protein
MGDSTVVRDIKRREMKQVKIVLSGKGNLEDLYLNIRSQRGRWMCWYRMMSQGCRVVSVIVADSSIASTRCNCSVSCC